MRDGALGEPQGRNSWLLAYLLLRPRPLAGDACPSRSEGLTTQVLSGFPHQPLWFPFCSTYPAPMARDFITLSDMPQAVLGITCDLCQRREQFDVEALKAQHGGDVKMPVGNLSTPHDVQKLPMASHAKDGVKSCQRAG